VTWRRGILQDAWPQNLSIKRQVNFTFDYRRADRPTVAYLKVIVIAMEFRQRKVNLSFSIENILREDFPHGKRTNVVDFPTVRESGLERWGTMRPLYRCYTVRYSPILMKSLPSMYKVEGRLHRVGEGKEQIPPEEEKKIEKHCLSCTDEAFRHSGGKYFIITISKFTQA